MMTAKEARKLTDYGSEEDRNKVESILPKIEQLITEQARKGKGFVEAFIYSPITEDKICVGGKKEQEKGMFDKQTTKRVPDLIIHFIARRLASDGYRVETFECGGCLFEGEYEMYTTGKIGHIIQIKW